MAARLELPSVSSLLMQLREEEEKEDAPNGEVASQRTNTHTVSVDRLHVARRDVRHQLSEHAEAELFELYDALCPISTKYEFSNEVCMYSSLVIARALFSKKSLLCIQRTSYLIN